MVEGKPGARALVTEHRRACGIPLHLRSIHTKVSRCPLNIIVVTVSANGKAEEREREREREKREEKRAYSNER